MSTNYTKYQEAKRFYNLLSNHSNENISINAKETINIYEQFKKEKGDFIAAYFILESYKALTSSLQLDHIMKSLYRS